VHACRISDQAAQRTWNKHEIFRAAPDRLFVLAVVTASMLLCLQGSGRPLTDSLLWFRVVYG
jgi:hypothetical protein